MYCTKTINATLTFIMIVAYSITSNIWFYGFINIWSLNLKSNCP